DRDQHEVEADEIVEQAAGRHVDHESDRLELVAPAATGAATAQDAAAHEITKALLESLEMSEEAGDDLVLEVARPDGSRIPARRSRDREDGPRSLLEALVLRPQVGDLRGVREVEPREQSAARRPCADVALERGDSGPQSLRGPLAAERHVRLVDAGFLQRQADVLLRAIVRQPGTRAQRGA